MATKRELWQHIVRGIQGSFPFGPVQRKTDFNGRLHCELGPAYISPTVVCWYVDGKRHGVYADIYGTVLNYFRGILVPKKYATEPDKLTVEEILTHPNTEVRYAGLEIYGYDRMRNEGHFKILHKDKKTGAELLQFKGKLEEPITVVQVLNSSPEEDGHFKKYFLSVPPTMKTCAEAIAWTFRKEADDYHPEVET